MENSTHVRARRLERKLSVDDVRSAYFLRTREQVAPYQQAVMFLFANRWRAKFCLRCGDRFVANAPKSIYCSDACFQSARKDSKKAWWNENRSQWRNKRTKSMKSKRSK